MLIKNMKPGDISEPQVFADERGRKTVRLVYFKERTVPHKENLKEDYNKISQRALDVKKSKALETWFKVNVPGFYIFIDADYQSCEELKDWNKVATEMATEKVY